MPTLEQIRDACVAKIAAIADIGKVHSYERYAAQQADMKSLYVATISGRDQLRGWFVRRTGTNETSDALGRYVVTHTWQIRGYMALEDGAASEKAFDALIEAIRDAFRSDENLGGLISSTVVEEGAGVQVEESAPVLFAGVLCHSARLKFYTRHYQ